MKIGVRHCEAALVRLLIKHLCRYHSAKSDCRTHFEYKQQSIENIESLYWVDIYITQDRTYNNAVFNCEGASWNEYPVTSSKRYCVCPEV